jgi:hypothetical protein
VAFCQDFDYDVFVSYAHLNNAKAASLDKGWVTDLHEALRVKLAEKLYVQPAIWRDEGGLDGKVLDDGIRQALENSAVFLAVVSGAFLASNYCVPIELGGFRHPRFPLVIRGSSRIVVVAYEGPKETPRSTWPEQIRDVPCVAFCDEFDDGSSRLYTRPQHSDPDEPYWRRLDELVRHLRSVLTEVKKGLSGAEVSTLAPPAPVAAPKPAPAWQMRWQKPMVHITYLSSVKARADQLANELRARCTVTLLAAEAANEKRQRMYMQNADGQILLFNCSDLGWAEEQALESLNVATQQGRPKRLAICADESCVNDFGIRSEFVVPIANGGQAADEFIASLGTRS